MTGFGRNSALITNIANGVTAVAATLVTLQLLKHVPRRPLLIIGLILFLCIAWGARGEPLTCRLFMARIYNHHHDDDFSSVLPRRY